VANGDLSQTMSLKADGRPLRGEFLHTARVVNTMVEAAQFIRSEATRVRAKSARKANSAASVVTGVSGTWKDLTESVNSMASNLTNQVRNIAGVTTAVREGDLTTKSRRCSREILELKNTINTMVDQLSSFASEVTRVLANRYGRTARRSGRSARRRRCVEGSDGLGYPWPAT